LTGWGVRSLGVGKGQTGFVDATPSSLYKGHRYPVEIISHCVWLYYRFPLSLREVEEMMLARGVRQLSTLLVSRPSMVFGDLNNSDVLERIS
jgi:hypothetical protein